LHKCFESANTLEDILRSIKVMEQNGALTPHEAQSVELKVKESMKDPLVKEWFCHDWDTIRNEADIILPNSISTRRPDRVMIQGDRVVVVDYKFGELHTRSHQKQMCTYMSLMSQMGYNHVEGYIWYIKSGEVVEC
ncbi:MAG: Dna2/Cas4 domain-containing protein, partial [Rikenellaceae bacterium]